MYIQVLIHQSMSDAICISFVFSLEYLILTDFSSEIAIEIVIADSE